MKGKMNALLRMLNDNMDNCNVSMKHEREDYIFIFEFKISLAFYTIRRIITRDEGLNNTLNELYEDILEDVMASLFEEIIEA